MARYALVVGISDYPNAGSLKSLRRTATDAKAVARALAEFGHYQIKLLSGKVTTEILAQELKNLFERAKNQEALIYFTGHGVKLTSPLGMDSGILAASDTIVRKVGDRAVLEGENAIKLNDLNQLVSQASLSSLVVFLDCCHSELVIDRMPQFSPDLVDHLNAFNRIDVDIFFMAACRKAEEAIARAGEPHSMFTGALLDAFASTQADTNGAITCGRVFDKVFGALERSEQEPRQLGRGRSIRLLTYPVEHPTVLEPVNFQNPYVGLAAFDEASQMYFYGRETVVRQLLDRLQNSRVLTVFGPSGSGKSSLVKAGLIPELRSNGLPNSAQWEIVTLTPGSSPLQTFQEAVSSSHQQSDPYVLFIDQFEELFTLCQNKTEQSQFIQMIVSEVERSQNLMKVIIAIRGDFLDRCAQIPESAKLINRDNEMTAYMVTDLDRSEMAAAIERPAQQQRASLEHGLLPEIIGDVGNQPGGLPLLQYALQKLWEVCVRPNSDILTLAGYRQVGRVQGALEQRAEKIYQDFHPDDRAFFLRTLIRELVYVPDDVEQMAARRRVSWQRLQEIASSDQIDRIVQQLIRERLLVANERTVEVAHETLLTHWHLIRDWVANNRESIRLSRLLELDCQEWLKQEKSLDYLLSEGRLAQIQEWRDREQVSLSQNERDFLEKSLEKRDRETQAELQTAKDKLKLVRRSWLLISGLFASVAIGALAFSSASRQATLAAQTSQVETLTTLASDRFEQNQQLEATLTALKAIKVLKQTSVPADKYFPILRNNILQSNEVNRLTIESRQNAPVFIIGLALHPKQPIMVTSDSKGVIRVWNLEGKLINTINAHADKIWNVKFNPDGDRLVSTSSDKTLKLWNTEDLIKSTSPKPIYTYTGNGDTVYDAVFSPKDNWLVSSSKNGILKVWSVDSQQKVSDHSTLDARSYAPKESVDSTNFYRIFAVDIDPLNNDLIAYGGSSDGNIYIWNKKQKSKPVSIGKNNSGTMFVKFSPNGLYLASADVNGSVKLWKRTEGSNNYEKFNTISAFQTRINSLTFDESSQYIAVASSEGTIKVWKFDHLESESTILKGHQGEVNRVVFSHDNKYLISTGDDGTVRFWFYNPKLVDSSHIQLINEVHKYGCSKIQAYLLNHSKISQEDKDICSL